MDVPQSIRDRLSELNNIIEQHPNYLPLPVVATLLGANAEGLRRSIECGQCPFGIAWQKTIKGNRAFKIPSITFYMWYTGVGIKDI